MNLNLLPCYQVVFCEERYFLSRWDIFHKNYECLHVTDEMPQYVGNCIVFHDTEYSPQTRKLYGLWWIDEKKGLCIVGDILFCNWMFCDGNFLCVRSHPRENADSELWEMVVPCEERRSLNTIRLGRLIGGEKFKCFVLQDENGKSVLSSFQRGYIQSGRQQLVIDEYYVANGTIWYRVGNDVFYSDEFPLPDGSKGWRFLKDTDGLKNWNNLTDGK